MSLFLFGVAVLQLSAVAVGVRLKGEDSMGVGVMQHSFSGHETFPFRYPG
jgi:hypothetical protein